MRQELPEGWDEKRVKEMADYYDEQAKNGLPLPRSITKRNKYALVEVPKKLLPAVRKLIADFERSEKASHK